MRIVQTPAAVLAGVAFLVPEGPAAGLLCVPWVAVTALLAAAGLSRLLAQNVWLVEEVAPEVGLVYALVSGAWLVISRLGARPLDLDPAIVLLTAVHFHFAGFCTNALTGAVARSIGGGDRRLPAPFRAAAVGTIVAPVLVAVGFTSARVLTVFGGIALAASVVTLSAFSYRAAGAEPRRLARVLLRASALASVPGMALVVLYVGTAQAPTIPQMVLAHGVPNSLGFVFLGLIGWSLARHTYRRPAPPVPLSRLAGRGRIGADFFARTGASTAVPRAGLIDSLAEYTRSDLDPRRVAPEIARFYERTAEYELLLRVRWHRGFAILGAIFARLARSVEQMNYDVPANSQERIASVIVGLDASRDGRPGARAWIRTFARSGIAVYVAAYATHRHGDEAYMNIAFPLPWSNVASILRLEHLGERGLLLTSRSRASRIGDEGVYLVTRRVSMRIPVDEAIRVWEAASPEVPDDLASLGPDVTVLRARHDVAVAGLRCVTLDYAISRGS